MIPKKQFSVIFRNQIMFKNSNMKNSFPDLFSMKIVHLHILQKFLKYSSPFQLLL